MEVEKLDKLIEGAARMEEKMDAMSVKIQHIPIECAVHSEKIDRIVKDVVEIKQNTENIGKRVANLELWKMYVVGAAALLAMFSVPIVNWLVSRIVR